MNEVCSMGAAMACDEHVGTQYNGWGAGHRAVNQVCTESQGAGQERGSKSIPSNTPNSPTQPLDLPGWSLNCDKAHRGVSSDADWKPWQAGEAPSPGCQ